MDTSSYQALLTSMESWERRVHTLTAATLQCCALCHLFHSHFTGNDDTCHGCPVHDATGRPHCDGTPYQGYAAAWEAGDATDEELRAFARDEQHFLGALVPAGMDDGFTHAPNGTFAHGEV